MRGVVQNRKIPMKNLMISCAKVKLGNLVRFLTLKEYVIKLLNTSVLIGLLMVSLKDRNVRTLTTVVGNTLQITRNMI